MYRLLTVALLLSSFSQCAEASFRWRISFGSVVPIGQTTTFDILIDDTAPLGESLNSFSVTGLSSNNTADFVISNVNLNAAPSNPIAGGFVAGSFDVTVPVSAFNGDTGRILLVGSANGTPVPGSSRILTAIPEPSSMVLLGVAGVCGAAYRRRKLKKEQAAA